MTSESYYSHILISAPPGVELVQDHREAQLEEDREADEESEVRGDVDVAHVVEAQYLFAVACAHKSNHRVNPHAIDATSADFDTGGHKKACSRGC